MTKDKNLTKQEEDDQFYMNLAQSYASRSKAIRAKVGACIVTSNEVVLGGYNGTPKGHPNTCEKQTEQGLVTLDSVIHAEMNCILKAAREGISLKDASIYITLSPCLKCSSMLESAGIKRVLYKDLYDYKDGVLPYFTNLTFERYKDEN